MTPLQFEATHAAHWQALEEQLDLAERGTQPFKLRWRRRKLAVKPSAGSAVDGPGLDGASLSALYRRACEHLALARARAYPIHLIQRLEQLTHRAHRLIYQRHDYGVARFKQLVLIDFPQSVRAHRVYLWIALLLFLVPTLIVGWACYRDPGFILHFVDATQVRSYDAMYDGSNRLGRERTSQTDWEMFGHYILHNIGIGFQCFAGGLFAGVGSVFYLVFNGVFGGGIAGYLAARGHGENFYSFIVTHAAFELTAIVLSGAAGLRIGHALVAPGRRTRVAALRHAAHDAIVVVYGVIGFLVIAAGLEAFWSSAQWVQPAVKYAVGAACWVLVIAYLGWQGRPRRVAARSAAAPATPPAPPGGPHAG